MPMLMLMDKSRLSIINVVFNFHGYIATHGLIMSILGEIPCKGYSFGGEVGQSKIAHARPLNECAHHFTSMVCSCMFNLYVLYECILL